MKTVTIDPQNWSSFLDDFSREYAGWRVTIEVLDRYAGPQNVAKGLALEGISLDVKGSRPSSVDISVCDWSQHHVNHVVDMPLHIRKADGADGKIDLQFEPAIGPMTLVHLDAPLIGDAGQGERTAAE